jgi:hypothetical protein
VPRSRNVHLAATTQHHGRQMTRAVARSGARVDPPSPAEQRPAGYERRTPHHSGRCGRPDGPARRPDTQRTVPRSTWRQVDRPRSQRPSQAASQRNCIMAGRSVSRLFPHARRALILAGRWRRRFGQNFGTGGWAQAGRAHRRPAELPSPQVRPSGGEPTSAVPVARVERSRGRPTRRSAAALRCDKHPYLGRRHRCLACTLRV